MRRGAGGLSESVGGLWGGGRRGGRGERERRLRKKKNKGSEAKERRREWGVSKTEMKREGGRTGESRGGEIISHKGGGSGGVGGGDGSTVNHPLMPSSFCSLPHCLHTGRGICHIN